MPMNQPYDLPASEIDRIMALMAAGQPQQAAGPVLPLPDGTIRPAPRPPVVSPMDAAMQAVTGAPRGPVFTPPQGQSLPPLAEAMGKPVNGQAAVGRPTTDVNPIGTKTSLERPGFFGRIRQRPGGSDALLQFGANLLSSSNIFEGLSRGALAYQNTLNAAEQAARPQSELLEDGAFISRYNPVTGERTFERTPIAEFQDGQLDRRLENSRLIASERNETQTDIAERRIASDQQLAQWRIEAERAAAEERMSHDERMAVLRAELERDNAGYRAGLELQALANGTSSAPPASISRAIEDYREAVDSTAQTISRIDRMVGVLDRGELRMGLARNLSNRAQLLLGDGFMSNEARNFAELQGLVRNMQNALLILNKGVQTDGDADRALAEIMQGGDAATVRRSLEIARREIQRRQMTARRSMVELSSTYGTDQGMPAPAPSAARGRTSGRTSTGVTWRVVQ